MKISLQMFYNKKDFITIAFEAIRKTIEETRYVAE